ncbi:6,7-dimethyl-8-ribityllumazine synthase [Candidatus Persebacteraceae bacterium Df01]|jgi:6,7-dimethyl-8-ribityllumazine synthase|uniref:6,7-dimethyl-8-ribityllumazine synthase n=1 Tax=Candidatus Doriopsillibacter californiensis TaxID=2970740 RepID=A0ABT7QMP0_9GAMM|nr:6,7-dimethyl-8-ribityllumazine synthase [Candidatus Persebacteraceae bacterium Df01]
MNIAIVLADFYSDISQQLLDSCEKALRGVGNVQTCIERVPGALEIPFALKTLANKNSPTALVALGCVIRGETYHFETVADICAQGILQVQMETGVPVGNGVLTVENMTQAQARTGKGADAALAAVRLAMLAGRP